ncbi:MAG: large subunit ribosomal protein L22 [Fusobacteria bacterium]|nr:MAG: large subunit ribosomal protein L22 [Fusobacteriota bacterium]KAF0228051.1 MAG: large subunit ribosomal protein [Fusobacteriota bacterium]
MAIKYAEENKEVAKAVMKYIRISPLKVRSVANEVRGKGVREAMGILKFTPRKAAGFLLKTLNSAMSNAETNNNLNKDALYISEIYIDEGPTLKRFKPRARGSADRILKRTSHITVVVKTKEV